MEIDDETFPLREAIEVLRGEILLAAENAKGSALAFTVGPIELEFNVVAKREFGGGGKLAFSIFGIGAKADASAKVAMERTQKVKLTLTPHKMDPVTGLQKPMDIKRPASTGGR